MTLQPSKYQSAVYTWVREGSGDAVINAVAGSGKTFTLIEASKIIHGRVLFAAFNSHIAKELQSRVGQGADCKTMHSIGYSAIAFSLPKGVRINMQEYKYADLAKTLYPQDQKKANDFANLIDLVRVSLVAAEDTAAIWDLIQHHGMVEEVTPEMVANIPSILKTGIAMGQQGVIDFTDMIWLPSVLNLRTKQYDFVLVDEAQDLSPAQLGLILKTRSRGGRMLFVGDPFQSIYGFAGADCDSFGNIKATLEATELPLSINYRCPTKVLDLARRIVPHIEARPDAPEGIVDYVKESELAQHAQEGDLVLCRLTAPLIRECIKMIRARKPARVRGRDIAKSLTSIVRKVAKLNSGTFTTDALSNWSAKEVAKIEKRPHHEAALQAHSDRVDGILACWEAFESTSLVEFCADIESLFSDGRASVMLSTIHKAKGLEENRVFILRPSKLPLFWKGQLEWEAKQESHLEYVALTRAKQELYFVTEDEE